MTLLTAACHCCSCRSSRISFPASDWPHISPRMPTCICNKTPSALEFAPHASPRLDIGTFFRLQGSISGDVPSHTGPCRASAESGCQRWADGMGCCRPVAAAPGIAGAGVQQPLGALPMSPLILADARIVLAGVPGPVFAKPEQRRQ